MSTASDSSAEGSADGSPTPVGALAAEISPRRWSLSSSLSSFSLRNLWIDTSKDKLIASERAILRHFVDDAEFDVCTRDIAIEFDTRPKKEWTPPPPVASASIGSATAKRSSMFSSLISSIGSMTSLLSRTEADATDDDAATTGRISAAAVDSKSDTELRRSATTKKSRKKKTSNLLSIHTTTITPKTARFHSAIDPRASDHSVAESPLDDSSSVISSALKPQSAADEKSVEMESGNGSAESGLPPVVLLHGYGCAGAYFFPSAPLIIRRIQYQLQKHAQRRTQKCAVTDEMIAADICGVSEKSDKSGLDISDFSEFDDYGNALATAQPTVHILDWLGIGLSSRPPFPSAYDVEDTERWHVESLEEWRKAMGIEEMVVVGHSLGGYMCAVYALQYPSRVRHLILLSPVGIPRRPSQSSATTSMDWKRRAMFKTLGWVWGYGFAPHDAVRWMGPKGKAWMKQLMTRRLFRVESPELLQLLSEYLYHVFCGQPSAEYALAKILAPGAWAHNPLIDRLPALNTSSSKQPTDERTDDFDFESDEKDEAQIGITEDSLKSSGCAELRDVIDSDIGEMKCESVEAEEEDCEEKYVGDGDAVGSGVLEQRVRVDAVYGETDWMSPDSLLRMQTDGTLQCAVHYIRNAGHQMVLENPNDLGRTIGSLVASTYRRHIAHTFREAQRKRVLERGTVKADAYDSSYSDSGERPVSEYVGRQIGGWQKERDDFVTKTEMEVTASAETD